jgi:hypothetical protein
MTLQGRFVVLVVLALGMIAGCGNPFWDGASASYFQNGGDAQDPDDTGFDDGAVQQDAPDVRMGDATPPVDQGSDATPSEDRVDTGAFADALDTGDVGQDATFADVVGDEGLVLVDVPLTEDVADAGSAPDVLEDAFAPLDTAIPVDTAPSLDVGQDVGADVGFDATSVATDGGDAGPSDTGPTCPSGRRSVEVRASVRRPLWIIAAPVETPAGCPFSQTWVACVSQGSVATCALRASRTATVRWATGAK